MSRNKRAKEDGGERVRDDASGESRRKERKKRRSALSRAEIICRYNRLPAGKKVKRDDEREREALPSAMAMLC